MDKAGEPLSVGKGEAARPQPWPSWGKSAWSESPEVEGEAFAEPAEGGTLYTWYEINQLSCPIGAKQGFWGRAQLSSRSVSGTAGASSLLCLALGSFGSLVGEGRPAPSHASSWLLHLPCMQEWGDGGKPQPALMTRFAFPQHMCPERTDPHLPPPNPARRLRKPLLHLAIFPGQGESAFASVTWLLWGHLGAGTLGPGPGSYE